MAENKLVVYSKHLAALAQCIESFLLLIFPFYWHHVYIPVLPAALMGYLQAPVPYIVGVSSSFKDIESPPEDATVIDLDACTVTVGGSPPSLPAKDKVKLLQRLREFAVLRLPPSHETPSMFSAFPGNQLQTCTTRSYIADPASSTLIIGAMSNGSLFQLDDDEKDDTPADRRTSTMLVSANTTSSPAPFVMEAAKETPASQPLEESRPRAKTSSQATNSTTAGSRTFVPKPNTDKIMQHSLGAFQKSLATRKNAAKAFFSGDSASGTAATATTSPSPPSSPTATAGADKGKGPDRTVTVRRPESLFIDPNDPASQPIPATPTPGSSGNSQPERIAFFNEDQIQFSFLRFFSSLLLGYRKYLKQPTEDEWNGTARLELFKSKEFISQLDSERRVRFFLGLRWQEQSVSPVFAPFLLFCHLGIHGSLAGDPGVQPIHF